MLRWQAQLSYQSFQSSSHWPHHHPSLHQWSLLLNKAREAAEVEAVAEDAEDADYQDHHQCQYQVPLHSIVGLIHHASTILSGAEPQLQDIVSTPP